MEFKFRAVDDRPTPYRASPSPSASMSYFSEQALRANHTRAPSFMQRDFYSIRREIEKERIKQEIIAAESVHRRVLEEEVRRELMMEREMAMHRAGEMGLSINERFTMQLHSRYPLTHQFDNRWPEDRFAFPGYRGLGFRHDVLPPIYPHFSDAVKDENKNALEVNRKDKLIILAKPDPNLCGTKRKATTAPAGSGELPLKSSKKPEWSCALCQVSATCERGLNQHLQGKKHKAKEARLKAQKMCNISTLQLKKTGKKIKLMESKDSAGSEKETKVNEESLQAKDTVDHSHRKKEDSKKKNGTPTAKKGKTKPAHKKKLKFWCETCQVGAHSPVVMAAHKKGKKHVARLKELEHKDEAAPLAAKTTTVASSEPSENTQDDIYADVAAKEVNDETTGNVTRDSDGSGSSIETKVTDLKEQTL